MTEQTPIERMHEAHGIKPGRHCASCDHLVTRVTIARGNRRSWMDCAHSLTRAPGANPTGWRRAWTACGLHRLYRGHTDPGRPD